MTVRPISIRWISDVPSKIVKIADYDRGADVTLISSAGRLPVPCGVSRAAFDDVASLREVVISETSGADVLVMATAVSDYRPASVSAGKIKKSPDGLSLELRARLAVVMKLEVSPPPAEDSALNLPGPSARLTTG